MIEMNNRGNNIFICIALLTVSSLFYVHQQVESVSVGYRIKAQERKAESLLDQNRSLMYNVAKLKTPGALEAKLLATSASFDMPVRWSYIPEENQAEAVKYSAAPSKFVTYKRFVFELLTSRAHAQD